MIRTLLLLFAVCGLAACNGNKFSHDASGTFEATEVLVSAEVSGKLTSFEIEEGDVLKQGQQVGCVDTVQLYLKKLQLQASKQAIRQRKPDKALQISATKEQIEKAKTEKNRLENLFKANAATQKQVDDIDSQLKVLQSTLAAQINTLSSTIGSLDEESVGIDIQIAQVDDLLTKSRILNPIDGTVLAKYVEAAEVVNAGKPLYKIADVKHLFLRAYLVSSQLESIKLGQQVQVSVNMGPEQEKTYSGKVAWISNKAEFTPKTIQTKDERQNLVYAIKVAVENTDGLLKIGMYGDLIIDGNSE